MLNQNQIKDNYFTTITDAKAAGRPKETCYVASTHRLYEYIVAGSEYTADDDMILTTGNGGDTRWVSSIPNFSVYTKTSSAVLTAIEVSGLNTLHNDGAGGEVILTWLALITGQEAIFYVNDAQYLQIKAPAGVTIRIDNSTVTAAGGYVRSNIVNNWIKIKAMPDGLVVIDSNGIWVYDE